MTDGLYGAVMVCGTASGAGKSVLVAAICRALARRGVRVAPFKAQNMSNNSAVTLDGAEIGRAQYAQALAAGVEPEAAMNPVLLKPVDERAAQVVVMGRPAGLTDARSYGTRTADLLPLVLRALDSLRRRFDVVVLEGAGSPAEVNLADRDIVNLRLASAARVPALLVGDIDRGGVFAALYGTLALLAAEQRGLVRAFVVNKFRGDPDLLAPGLVDLQARTGVRVAGVIPWEPGLVLDDEDSLSLDDRGPERPPRAGGLEVAVVRLPRISNFTDLDPLAAEPDVAVRFVDRASALGSPDLVVIPGTRNTVADLAWLRATGLAEAILVSRAHVLGVCGGYQMLGRVIVDDVESRCGRVSGLGLLDVETTFEEEKVVRRRRGQALGEAVSGYEIRHGRPRLVGTARGWFHLDDEHGAEVEGCTDTGGRVWGTSVHGLLESDGFRRAFLAGVAQARGRTFWPGDLAFAEVRARRFDRLADLADEHLDWALLEEIVADGRLAAVRTP